MTHGGKKKYLYAAVDVSLCSTAKAAGCRGLTRCRGTANTVDQIGPSGDIRAFVWLFKAADAIAVDRPDVGPGSPVLIHQGFQPDRPVCWTHW
jgi:hypothetical protein